MKELQHIKRGQNKKSAFIDMRKVLFAKNDGSGKIMKLDSTFLEVDDTDIFDLKKFDTDFLKTPSYLINKKHILCFTDKTVMMIDGSHIELNESDMARVKNSFTAADTTYANNITVVNANVESVDFEAGVINDIALPHDASGDPITIVIDQVNMDTEYITGNEWAYTFKDAIYPDDITIQYDVDNINQCLCLPGTRNEYFPKTATAPDGLVVHVDVEGVNQRINVLTDYSTEGAGTQTTLYGCALKGADFEWNGTSYTVVSERHNTEPVSYAYSINVLSDTGWESTLPYYVHVGENVSAGFANGQPLAIPAGVASTVNVTFIAGTSHPGGVNFYLPGYNTTAAPSGTVFHIALDENNFIDPSNGTRVYYNPLGDYADMSTSDLYAVDITSDGISYTITNEYRHEPAPEPQPQELNYTISLENEIDPDEDPMYSDYDYRISENSDGDTYSVYFMSGKPVYGTTTSMNITLASDNGPASVDVYLYKIYLPGTSGGVIAPSGTAVHVEIDSDFYSSTARCRVYRDGSNYSVMTLGDLYAIDLVSDGMSYTVTQEYHAQTEPA